MPRIVEGYVLVIDQGDPKILRPVLYVRMNWPPRQSTICRANVSRTTDIQQASLFVPGSSRDREALTVVNQLHPEAVPVRVKVTRVFDIIVEIPE